jgi:hypothetical protein
MDLYQGHLETMKHGRQVCMVTLDTHAEERQIYDDIQSWRTRVNEHARLIVTEIYQPSQLGVNMTSKSQRLLQDWAFLAKDDMKVQHVAVFVKYPSFTKTLHSQRWLATLGLA